MRGLVGTVMVLAACGGAPSREPVANQAAPVAPAWKQVEPPRRISVPRPDIGVEQLVPDFHQELRWPLSAMAHPELAPQFEIANVFAMPGIGWIELCERGVQNRVQAGRNRDELEYLRGWCKAIKGDADSACGTLKPLLTTTVLGMANAVRHDLANIIANAGDIDAADKLLNKHRIDDLEILDILAATFIELGREQDALEMNRRAMDSVGHTTNAEHCHRLTKNIALGGNLADIKKLADLATNLKVPDETCIALYQQARCFIGPAQNCHDYFKAIGVDTRNTFLLHAVRSWPRQPETHEAWTNIVYAATNAGPIEGAKEVATLALDAAMKTAPDCHPRTLGAIWLVHREWPTDGLDEALDRCNRDPGPLPAAAAPTAPASAPAASPPAPPEPLDDGASVLPSAKQ